MFWRSRIFFLMRDSFSHSAIWELRAEKAIGACLPELLAHLTAEASSPVVAYAASSAMLKACLSAPLSEVDSVVSLLFDHVFDSSPLGARHARLLNLFVRLARSIITDRHVSTRAARSPPSSAEPLCEKQTGAQCAAHTLIDRISQAAVPLLQRVVASSPEPRSSPCPSHAAVRLVRCVFKMLLGPPTTLPCPLAQLCTGFGNHAAAPAEVAAERFNLVSAALRVRERWDHDTLAKWLRLGILWVEAATPPDPSLLREDLVRHAFGCLSEPPLVARTALALVLSLLDAATQHPLTEGWSGATEAILELLVSFAQRNSTVTAASFFVSFLSEDDSLLLRGLRQLVAAHKSVAAGEPSPIVLQFTQLFQPLELFFELLQLVAFDHLTLMDFLVDNADDFLPLLFHVLRLFGRAPPLPEEGRAPEPKRTCRRDLVREQSLACLAQFRESLERAQVHGSLPFDCTALLRRLSCVCPA
eukprot:gnl/Spiro4/1974_TR942_c0_g1_i1.p1 gnl/Spiro4/1974_TR942_c0_g1~~gnl/Spiro4/1974_TR942_c0_g1_i1.p1  ORF type:complete len:473 (+),score=83.31 gnl/Spiro4/1974_TR942_c0_g1_i1:68-1486(+)